MMGSILDVLFDLGELDQTMEVVDELTDRAGNENVIGLKDARAAHARVLAIRGQAAHVADSLDWIEDISRAAGAADDVVIGLGHPLSLVSRSGRMDK